MEILKYINEKMNEKIIEVTATQIDYYSTREMQPIYEIGRVDPILRTSGRITHYVTINCDNSSYMDMFRKEIDTLIIKDNKHFHYRTFILHNPMSMTHELIYDRHMCSYWKCTIVCSSMTIDLVENDITQIN